MDKILYLTYNYENDFWGDLDGESIQGKSDSGTEIKYNVWNLNECPEDAVIGRDLISAHGFVDILRLGMQLAKEGYSKIEVIDKGERKDL